MPMTPGAKGDMNDRFAPGRRDTRENETGGRFLIKAGTFTSTDSPRGLPRSYTEDIRIPVSTSVLPS